MFSNVDTNIIFIIYLFSILLFNMDFILILFYNHVKIILMFFNYFIFKGPKTWIYTLVVVTYNSMECKNANSGYFEYTIYESTWLHKLKNIFYVEMCIYFFRSLYIQRSWKYCGCSKISLPSSKIAFSLSNDL